MAQRLTDLIPDPRNARAHNDRNVGMIGQAIAEVGTGRSIVIDEDDVILAGNATVQAAQQAGIERVTVVETDGDELVAVRRRGLTPEQKAKLALYDNRAAELADWDAGVLAELGEELDLSTLFRPEEFAAILEQAGSDIIEQAGIDTIPEQWMVLIECKTEREQAALLERLTAEGLTCRALTS